ncbi:myomegalin-like [Osmerus eperlanus]|uniref:myomegalin-like n=1 Tax=Osmerus eperlanus TaxID=29151 RepID=UPI002E15640D
MDLKEEHGSIGPVTAHVGLPWTMKKITEIISDLKKDNFNLRLRIFYYEECLQKKCDGSVEEMCKTNINLNVEVETLKEEMRELQRVSVLAIETSSEMELLRQTCNVRTAQLEKDLELSKIEVGKLVAMLEQEEMRVLELENEVKGNHHSDTPTQTDPQPQDKCPNQNQDLLNLLAEKDCLIEQLQASVKSQDTVIEQLQASVKSQDTVIEQLRTDGVRQVSGDQPAGDPDSQLTSLIEQQVLEQDISREKRKFDKQLKDIQELLERSNVDMAEKDFLLADSDFKLKEQDVVILKLNHKLQEKDQLLQQASEKASFLYTDERSREEDAAEEKDSVDHLRQCMQQQERELQMLNNLLFSHEDSIHALETELVKMKALQETLEQANEDLAEKDFVLMESETKLKEMEETIQTLTCELQEKNRLTQSSECSDSNANHQQEAALQKQLQDLEQASERAREDMLSVIEEKNREICRLQESLLDFQSHPPPTQANLLSHIQDSINRAKEKIICAIECKANNSSNMSQLLQKIIDLQAKNTEMSYQDIINSLCIQMKERDLDVDQNVEAFKCPQTEQELEENLTETRRDEDQATVFPQKPLTEHNTEVMDGWLQRQNEEGRIEIEQLKQRLRETEATLAQSKAENLKQMTDYQQTVATLQAAINMNAHVLKALESLMEDVDQELEPAREILRQLQPTKGSLEDYISHLLQEKNFIISQLQEESSRKSQQLEVMVGRLQSQKESSDKDLEELEQHLRDMEAILNQTKQDSDMKKLKDDENDNTKVALLELQLKELEATLATEEQLAEEKLQNQADNSTREVEQLEQKLLETEAVLAKTKEADEERGLHREKQLTDYKATVEKLLATISFNERMFKELKEHQQQVVGKHADELQEFNRRQQELWSAQSLISASLQEKSTEVLQLRDTLFQKEKVIKDLQGLTLQRKETSVNGEAPAGQEILPLSERRLQVVQKEKGSLMERLRASDRLNETLHSQLSLHRDIVAQDNAHGFTSSSLTVDNNCDEDPCMPTMGQSYEFTDKCLKPTGENKSEFGSQPGFPPQIININCVTCGASRHSSRTNLSDTWRRYHVKMDDNASQSSWSSCSMEDSVPSSLTSSLSALWVQEKTCHVQAQTDDSLTLQRLISEGNTLTNVMIQLLQDCFRKPHADPQATVDQKLVKQLSATIAASQHALEEASRLLKHEGRNSTQLKSKNVTPSDFNRGNLELKNEIEMLTMGQCYNKKMLSEAIKRLRKVNRRKL